MRPRRPRILTALGAAVAVLLCAAAPASAQRTLGEIAPPGGASGFCKGGSYDVVPGGTAAPLYTVPAAGVITSWSTRAGSGAWQELIFKAFRPAGAGVYFPKFTVVGRDGPRALAEGAIDTFAVEIPVEAGDLIGLDDANASAAPNSCVFASGPGDHVFQHEGDLAVGQTFEPEEGEEEEGEVRLNVAATLLLAPTISSLSPSGGPAAGGTRVTITGTEFADVRAVTIGSVPAAFEVVSETSITATAPSGPAGASVPVTVTTAAGSATATFAYGAAAAPAGAAPAPAPRVRVHHRRRHGHHHARARSCTVPGLKGRELKDARWVLHRRHCRLGKVIRGKGVSVRRGRVARQWPRPGTVRRAWARVDVRLG